MKHIQHYIWSVMFFLAYSPTVKALNGREILERSYHAIETLKQVNYQYEQDINYTSEDYKNSLKGQTFLNFNERAIGSKALNDILLNLQ